MNAAQVIEAVSSRLKNARELVRKHPGTAGVVLGLVLGLVIGVEL